MFVAIAALSIVGAVLLLQSPIEEVNSPNPAFSEPLRTLTVGDVKLQVAIADEPHERTQGLSGTKKLLPGTGMLFVFEEDGDRGFWMKDMLFSIDMIWISSDGMVVDVTHSASPESYPRVFSPSEPVQYVLEVPSGFSVEHSIQKDLKVSVEMALR